MSFTDHIQVGVWRITTAGPSGKSRPEAQTDVDDRIGIERKPSSSATKEPWNFPRPDLTVETKTTTWSSDADVL
jgi:hypothetical protein